MAAVQPTSGDGRGGPVPVAPSELGPYARAAAQLAGLTVAEEWWPGVLRFLALIVNEAAKVEAVGPVVDPPAPVFEP
jgi:hypothetical protein